MNDNFIVSSKLNGINQSHPMMTSDHHALGRWSPSRRSLQSITMVIVFTLSKGCLFIGRAVFFNSYDYEKVLKNNAAMSESSITADLNC